VDHLPDHLGRMKQHRPAEPRREMGRFVAYARAVMTLFEQAVIIAAQDGSLTRTELEQAWAHSTQNAEPLLRSIAVNVERDNAVYFRKLVGRALPKVDVRHTQRAWITAGLQALADIGRQMVSDLLEARADSAREDARPRATSPTLTAARVSNVHLIKGMTPEQRSRLVSTFEKAQTTGVRHESLVDKVQKITGSGLNRAKLIARDQTVKYNATVRQEQARSLGIKFYIWRCTDDRDVRPYHRKLNGRKFSYDNPPVTDAYGHRHAPGEDFNCRCVDEPIIDLFAGLDANLGDTLTARRAKKAR
jgi:SPP1 gp7 family putative phage head morphogenesis protein